MTGAEAGGQRRGMEKHSSAEARRHRRRRLALVLGGGACALVFTAWAATWPAARWDELANHARMAGEQVRSLGAGWFFAAFAVLPALGVPVSIFALSAGPLFVSRLGLPAVLALSGASMAVSMVLAYALARWALRPWLVRLLGFLGYSAPTIPAGKRRLATLLLRITPGPPYALQNVILGLGEVPLSTYLAISWPVCTFNVCLFVIFGDALASGKGRVALIAVAGVVIGAVVVKLVRDRLARRGRTADAGAAGEGGA